MRKQQNHPGNRPASDPGPADTRMTQRVLVSVKEEFIAACKEDTALNGVYGAGDQLTAAMMVWLKGLPDEWKLVWLEWSRGLRPYDPKFGERMKAALSRLVSPPSIVPSDPPDKPGNSK